MSEQGRRHWIVRIDRLAGVLLVLACLLSPAKTLANPTEAELRAAVIVAIMRFTTWPQVATEPPSNLQVCLSGEPQSASHLLRVSGQQKIAGRTVQVAGSPPDSDIGACHVLVLGEVLNRERFSSLLQAADNHSILTVCDGCENSRHEDTIIHLTLRKQRVNFEVNLAKAKSNGVALDAQLLELASVVRK